MIKSVIFVLCIISISFSQVTIGKNIEQFKIKDQFNNTYQVEKTTKKIIFVFAKESGHTVKDLLNTKQKDFLTKRDILFVVDASAMPAFMKIFILPFTGYDYPILTIEEEKVSKKYINEKYKEKIMIVSLENRKVVDILYIDDKEELLHEIEN
jgi:hypothetical protein